MSDEQRITLAQRQPNPLFEHWLTEWLRFAVEKDSMKRFALTKALESLRRYPLPLLTGRECCILDGFGPTICAMLDKQLAVHRLAQNRVEKTPAAMPMSTDSEQIDIGRREVLQLVGERVVEEQQKIRKQSSEQPPNKASRDNREQTSVMDLYRKYDEPVPKQPAVLASNVYKATSTGSTTTSASANSVPMVDKAAEVPPPLIEIVKQGTFDILLLVDTAETAGKSKRSLDVTIQELERHKVRYEVRRLSVGDFLWICRCRSSAREFVLPHIVERKRMDDLAASIKDGRYHEQKFRLSDSGIADVVYMVESRSGASNAHAGLPLATLYQAATNTQVHNGFAVRYTDSHADSMRQLAVMTELMLDMYSDRNLLVCTTTKADSCASFDRTSDTTAPPVRVLHYGVFTARTTKMRNFTVRDMFIRQLLQLKTLSLDKAMAIVRSYPTPSRLVRAFDECQRNGTAGDLLLARLEFGASKRTIGPAISKSVYQLFTQRHST